MVFLVSCLFIHHGWASDACSNRAILTVADVQVSDGSSFRTESFFQSAEASAIRHIREDNQIVAVEGPVAWMSRGNKTQVGGDQLRSFALGHQVHAMLLHFEEVASGIADRTEISFDGGIYPGSGGDLKYGGKIFLVQDVNSPYPLGFVIELPGQTPMEISFSEWRTQDGTPLPFLVRIDDGTRVFEYAYTRVDLDKKPLNWFLDSIEAPAIDELQIYRLHRRLLAAHCAGNADEIADLTTPETIVSSRGELRKSSREETRSSFERVFKQVDYNQYLDLLTPVVEVSSSGDIGWIGVNVRAIGKEIVGGQPFESQWSWVMLTRKVNGVWLNAGNASNHLPLPATEN
jgi:ketosteroid isomerase-like protein